MFITFLLLFIIDIEKAHAWTGSGTEQDPYVLYTAADFVHFANNLYFDGNDIKHYVLGNDIDFTGVKFVSFSNEHTRFRGTFDGKGHVISNVNATESYSYRGIFGRIENAVIKNIKIKKATINGGQYTGGLVGTSYNSQIMNCSLEDGKIDGGENSGGLVGGLFNSTLKDSYAIANVTVTGGGTNFGGLVGSSSGSTISNTFFKGHVRNQYGAGGLVGYHHANSVIKESFAEATVELYFLAYPVGGIAGENEGEIRDSYFIGTVIGENSGGLVGRNNSKGSVINSYAANTFTDPYRSVRAGGITHINFGTLENLYWDSTLSKKDKYAYTTGGTVTNVAKKSTTDMKKQSTYTGWDFTNVWGINAGEYPHIKRANVVGFDSTLRNIQIETGQTASVNITAFYSNGTTGDVTNLVTVDLNSLPGTTFSKADGKLHITGGQEAKGYLTVTYKGVSNQYPVTVKRAPVSASKSTVVADQQYVIADNSTTSNVTVTVVDEWNNPLRGLSVSLYENDGGQHTVTSTQQATNQHGQATFTVKSSKLGPITYYAVVEDRGEHKTIQQLPTIHFIPGPPSADKSSIVITSTGTYVVGRDKADIFVTILDQFSNPIENAAVELIANPSTPEGFITTIGPSNSKTNMYGNATFEVRSLYAQPFTITTKVNGTVLPGLSTNITFIPDEVNGAQSLVSIGNEPIIAGRTRDLLVQLRDKHGNPLQSGGDAYLIGWDTTILRGKLSFVKDNGNGTYTYRYTAPDSTGIDMIHVKVGGETSLPQIQLSVIPDGVSGSQSEIIMDNTPIIAGETRELQVVLKDQYGNRLTSGGDAAKIQWDPFISGHISLIKDNNDGTYTYRYVAPTTVGTDAITGYISGTQLSKSLSLTIIPGAIKKVDIEPLNRSVVVGEELLITLTLKDQYNNFVDDAITLIQTPGSSAVITPVNGGVSSDGIVQFQLSNTKAETVAYEVMANGKAIGVTFDVQFITSNIDITKSEFSQNKLAATTNDQDQIELTITLRDKYGNPVPNVKVGVEAPVDSSAMPSQLGIDFTDTNGSVTFDIKSTIVGERTFRIFYVQENSEVLLSDYAITFTAGDVDIDKSSWVLTKSEVTADGIDAAELIIVLKDHYQNPVPNIGLVVHSNSTNVQIENLIHPTNVNGEVKLKASSLVAEKVKLIIDVDDPNLSDPSLEEIEITFVPGQISKSVSTVTSDTPIIRVDQQQFATITVEVKDEHHNPIPDQRVTLQQSGSSTITPDPAHAVGEYAITDQAGIAQFVITSTKAETVVYQAVVTDGLDHEVTLNATVALTITSGPMYAGNSEMTVTANRLVADGSSTAMITVQLKDEFGNNLTDDGGTLEIFANSDPLTVNQAVYGTYVAELLAPTISGKVLITAYVIDSNGDSLLLPVQEEIDFIPGSAAVETSTIQVSQASLYADGTSQTRVIVQLKDQYGNDLTDDTYHGDVVEIITNLGTISATHYIGNGQYEAVLTASSDIDTATLTAMLNQASIDQLATVDFTLGPVSLAKSTITAVPPSVTADGKSTVIVQVQLMDDYGHKIERNEGKVVLTTTIGTIGEADYVIDGLYEATFTAGMTAGQAVITGSLNGDALLEKAEIQLTPIYIPGPGASPVNPMPTVPASETKETDQRNVTVYHTDGTETIVSIRDEDITFNRSIMIETDWQNGETKLSFHAQTLEHIQILNPTQSIDIQMGSMLYQFPVNQLHVDQITELLDDRDFEIVVEVQAADEETALSALTAAQELGAEMLMTPVEFTIMAKSSKGRTIHIDTFTQYITRSFLLNGNIDPQYVTGARFHSDTSEYEPVPTTFEQKDDKTIVHLHSLSNSYYTVVKNNISFSDMQTHWAKSEVERMANKWIIKGKGNNRFDPMGELTRAEAIALLVRALGLNNVSEDSPYRDIGNEWFIGAVHTAYKAGLIAETQGIHHNNLLMPKEEISREEFVVMLVHALQYTEESVQDEGSEVLIQFKDSHMISDWAKTSIVYTVDTGILKGDNLGYLNPNNTITRAEAAVLLDRLLRTLGLSN